MKINKDDNGFEYLTSIEDAKPDFNPIKVWSILQFYRLDGRKTVITKDNIIPINDLKYCVFSPHEQKYYIREFHSWELSHAYFYKRDLDFSGEDEAIEALKRYIADDNVWLLMTQSQVDEITLMLKRLWKSYLKDEGKLPYRSWINLLRQSLDLEDYRKYGKELTGFRTVCHQYEQRIRAIWDEAYKTNLSTTDKTNIEKI